MANESNLKFLEKTDLDYAIAGALLHNLGKIASRFQAKMIKNEETLTKKEKNYLFQHILGLVLTHDLYQIEGLWEGNWKKVTSSMILFPATVRALTHNLIKFPEESSDTLISLE